MIASIQTDLTLRSQAGVFGTGKSEYRADSDLLRLADVLDDVAYRIFCLQRDIPYAAKKYISLNNNTCRKNTHKKEVIVKRKMLVGIACFSNFKVTTQANVIETK